MEKEQKQKKPKKQKTEKKPKTEQKESKLIIRRPNPNDWVTEESLTKIKEWGLSGLTMEQIAQNMGITKMTLYNWMHKFPELAEQLKISRETADANVENALYNAAMSGNVTAQIFWLKNRKKDEWGEKKEEKQDTVKIEITL